VSPLETVREHFSSINPTATGRGNGRDTEPVVVHLRDTVTGDTKQYEICGYFAGDEFWSFAWKEGNFSCDCNRAILLWDGAETEFPCGTGRIIVEKIVRVKTGATVYREPAAP
jgi:hypothetical protein